MIKTNPPIPADTIDEREKTKDGKNRKVKERTKQNPYRE